MDRGAQVARDRRRGPSRATFLGLVLGSGLTALAGSAHADTIFQNTDICSTPLWSSATTSVFVQGYAGGGLPSVGNMYMVSGDGSSWTWQAIDTSASEALKQIGCASSFPSQQIVAYRSTVSSGVKVRELQTGWSESTISGASDLLPYALWVTEANGNFALFVLGTTGTSAPFPGHLYMALRSTAAGSPWSTFSDLGMFPGGIGIADFNSMGGYEYFAGPDSATYVSVFFAVASGDLIENRGTLVASDRIFVNHGHPSAGFDTINNRVSVTAFKNPVGHQPPYSESEWVTELRTLGADGNVYAKHANGALLGAPWESMMAAGVTMITAAGFGCFPNTCSNRTVGIAAAPGTMTISSYDALAYSPFTRGPWTTRSQVSNVSSSQLRPTLLNTSTSATGTQIVYPETSNNLALYDIPSASKVADLGHP